MEKLRLPEAELGSQPRAARHLIGTSFLPFWRKDEPCKEAMGPCHHRHANGILGAFGRVLEGAKVNRVGRKERGVGNPYYCASLAPGSS